MEFQRWWVLKCKLFAQKSTCSKETVVLWDYGEHQFLKKVQKLYFQGQFSMSVNNRQNLFKKKSFQNINLGDHFLWKKKIVISIFEPLYFLKSCPIFDKLALPVFSKYVQRFPLSMSIFGQKACILRPTIFKIPQPNWH